MSPSCSQDVTKMSPRCPQDHQSSVIRFLEDEDEDDKKEEEEEDEGNDDDYKKEKDNDNNNDNDMTCNIARLGWHILALRLCTCVEEKN